MLFLCLLGFFGTIDAQNYGKKKKSKQTTIVTEVKEKDGARGKLWANLIVHSNPLYSAAGLVHHRTEFESYEFEDQFAAKGLFILTSEIMENAPNIPFIDLEGKNLQPPNFTVESRVFSGFMLEKFFGSKIGPFFGEVHLGKSLLNPREWYLQPKNWRLPKNEIETAEFIFSRINQKQRGINQKATVIVGMYPLDFLRNGRGLRFVSKKKHKTFLSLDARVLVGISYDGGYMYLPVDDWTGIPEFLEGELHSLVPGNTGIEDQLVEFVVARVLPKNLAIPFGLRPLKVFGADLSLELRQRLVLFNRAAIDFGLEASYGYAKYTYPVAGIPGYKDRRIGLSFKIATKLHRTCDD
ncbi:MAG: hypothetical protein ACI83D_000670 [Planctomycetota bacterium]